MYCAGLKYTSILQWSANLDTHWWSAVFRQYYKTL